MDDETVGFVNIKDDPLYLKGYEAACKELAAEMQEQSRIIGMSGERDQRVAEACADVCADLWTEWSGYKDANDCTEAIRSGEWKKHMKGGE